MVRSFTSTKIYSTYVGANYTKIYSIYVGANYISVL